MRSARVASISATSAPRVAWISAQTAAGSERAATVAACRRRAACTATPARAANRAHDRANLSRCIVRHLVSRFGQRKLHVGLVNDPEQRIRILRVRGINRREGANALLQILVGCVSLGGWRIAAGTEQACALGEAIAQRFEGRKPVLHFVFAPAVVARSRRGIGGFGGSLVAERM